jgi:hypothetical protein
LTRLQNAAELLAGAVHTLAAGRKDIKGRVLDAYTHHVIHVQETDLPEDLRPLIRNVHSSLSSGKLRFEGDSVVAATLYRMHGSKAAEIAQAIWELHRSTWWRAHSEEAQPACELRRFTNRAVPT